MLVTMEGQISAISVAGLLDPHRSCERMHLKLRIQCGKGAGKTQAIFLQEFALSNKTPEVGSHELTQMAEDWMRKQGMEVRLRFGIKDHKAYWMVNIDENSALTSEIDRLRKFVGTTI